MSVESELIKLEKVIKFFARGSKFPGMDKKDLEQELRLLVAKSYVPNKKQAKIWWKRKFRWFIINLSRKFTRSKKPMDNAVSIDEILENLNEV